jgi:peptidoglycan hydrolase-like protein with peptidoglycan-binding domain
MSGTKRLATILVLTCAFAAARALHHYTGGIDGIPGRRTKRAIRRFQRSHHLHADGVAGPRTRKAMGRRGRPLLGRRIIHRGNHGWDVAATQFMLRRRGFAVSVDGGYGAGTLRAVKRFQGSRGLPVDGRVGHLTLGRLRRTIVRHHAGGGGGAPSGPVRFLRPVHGAMGDGFGFVGGRRHTGIDFPEPLGTPVGAAGRGVVTFAGWNSGGYGNLMIVRHRLGFETWYAHLSAFTAHVGQGVAGGVQIARVGSTGRSTGPHLHFEVRRNGVPINPLPYLLGATSLKPAPKAQTDGLECSPEPMVRWSDKFMDDPRRAVLEDCR